MRGIRPIAAFAILALAFSLAPAKAAVPTVVLESQAWWAIDGIDVPSNVGHHVHVQANNFPAPGAIVDGPYDLQLKLTLHEQVGTTNWIRIQEADGSGQTERAQVPIAMGPCVDCTREITIPLNFSQWRTGRQEVRISLNVPDEQPGDSGSQRMFQSTGWQVCVRSCTPTYRSGDFIEARGWYDNRPQGVAHEYQNARLTSPLSTVRAGGTVRVELKPGSGGRPTTFSGVYLDPNMHAHDAGTVLLTRSGQYIGTVTIPSNLAPGNHSLVMLASDGQNAGVLRIPFTVGDSPPPTSTPTPTPPPTATPTLAPTPVPPTPTPVITPTAIPTCSIP